MHSQFDGIGDSPGRNQLGEFWPDVWSFDAESSYGGTVIGVGLESSLGALVLCAELRQTFYDTEAWVTPFTDLRVTVPTALDIEQSDLVVGAIWTF